MKLFCLVLPLITCLLGVIQAQPLQWQDRRFSIDECGIRYNGEPLPLGRDTMEWVRVLGPPDRRLPEKFWVMGRTGIGYMIWDSHGLALHFGKAHDTTWVQSAIFFLMGLDSQEGQTNSLQDSDQDYADGYVPISKAFEAKLRSDTFPDAEDQSLFHADPRNFPYPVTPVRSQVRVDGTPLSPYVKVGELNRMRIAQELPLFKHLPYRDFVHDNWDWMVYDLKAFYYDSTFAGNYLVHPLRTCQGLYYEWVLRYSKYKRLVHLRISTYPTSENAEWHASQWRLDAYESRPGSKVKDGKQPEANKFYERHEKYTKKQYRQKLEEIRKVARGEH